MIRTSSGWGVALLLAAIFASEVFAWSAPVAQSAGQRRSNPYSSLFQPAPLVKPSERSQATQPSTPANPKVVCDLTVFPMRVIDPRICKPDAR